MEPRASVRALGRTSRRSYRRRRSGSGAEFPEDEEGLVRQPCNVWILTYVDGRAVGKIDSCRADANLQKPGGDPKLFKDHMDLIFECQA